MHKKRLLKITCTVPVALIVLLFIIRFFSYSYLDDVHPDIPCEESLLNKVDYLAVIPLYNNNSIGDEKEWCDYIGHLNKTLIMHGIYHTYNEFNEDRNQEYIIEGEVAFRQCFGFDARDFKPPQLQISDKNLEILKKDYKIHTNFKQLTHKAHHCNDSGRLPNWLISLV
jgi:predicted deacetylase